MDVTYGTTSLAVPPDAEHTEITTYMWPGFLGELIETTGDFEAWELLGPNQWLLRPDILAPPYSCIGVATVLCWRWISSEGRWMKEQESAIWRRIG